jgi:RIO-like serine/threonine protein kinase
MRHVRHSMETALHLNLGVRECLVLATIWEYALVPVQTIADCTSLTTVRVKEIIKVLVKDGLVVQEWPVEPRGGKMRPIRPDALWCLSGPAKLKIIEWEAGKGQASPVPVRRRR